jgi:hypothetical protein
MHCIFVVSNAAFPAKAGPTSTVALDYSAVPLAPLGFKMQILP